MDPSLLSWRRCLLGGHAYPEPLARWIMSFKNIVRPCSRGCKGNRTTYKYLWAFLEGVTSSLLTNSAISWNPRVHQYVSVKWNKGDMWWQCDWCVSSWSLKLWAISETCSAPPQFLCWNIGFKVQMVRNLNLVNHLIFWQIGILWVSIMRSL